jgi:hypothetical protein
VRCRLHFIEEQKSSLIDNRFFQDAFQIRSDEIHIQCREHGIEMWMSLEVDLIKREGFVSCKETYGR